MEKRTCSVDGCDRDHYGRGLCSKHYQYEWHHGRLPPLQRTLEDRFWAKVDKNGPDGCWLWTAYLAPAQYGMFSIRTGIPRLSHIVAYELVVGPVPKGMELDHVCHTLSDDCPGGVACLHRRCVNPAHLEPVTQRENMRRVALRNLRLKLRGQIQSETNRTT